MCLSDDVRKTAVVTLCDLYQHPEQYAGQMVKVRAGSRGTLQIENMLHDSHPKSCSAYIRMLVEFPEQLNPVPGFELVRDDSYKKFVEALRSRDPIRVDATYEGRFDPAFVWREQKRIRVGHSDIKGLGKKHDYDGRIVLRQVSDVWTALLPGK